MSGVTELDVMWNEIIRGTAKVGEISKEVGLSGVGLYREKKKNM